MKIAIMQPYLFPYIGYWQLIYAVDEFVLLDDVNYIMRGYINRNNILLNGKSHRFTVPIQKASQNKLIMETKLNFSDEDKRKFLATIQNAYHKSNYYAEVMPLLEDIIGNPEDDLTEFIMYSIQKINHYLDIQTNLKRSSQIEKDASLKAQDRIIEICKKEKADIYINPCGGRKLYQHSAFEENRLQLYFLDVKQNEIFYKQKPEEFVGNLSIIDVLMNSSADTIQQFLNAYEFNL